DSLVIRAGESEVKTSTDNVAVSMFSRNETIEYVKRFAPNQESLADSWYQETGGLPSALDELRRGDETDLSSLSRFTRDLSENEQDILYKLLHLPNGVDSELATEYVAPKWLDVLRLD